MKDVARKAGAPLGTRHIEFLTSFRLFNRPDKALCIEKQITEAFQEQIPVYDDE